MNRAYIALGANIEPRARHLQKALAMMEDHPHITMKKQSSIYETAPVGYTYQADFLNMAAEIDTSLSAPELLDVCQQIEQELGRKRAIRYGPRTIDLDILLYNQENKKRQRLTIPHPSMHERAFVLIPLGEIAPEAIVPRWNQRVRDLIDELPETDKKDVSKWTESGSAEG